LLRSKSSHPGTLVLSCLYFVSPISHPKLITSHDLVSALHLVAWPCTSSALYRFCHNQLKSHG
jgi:hypothetical protein